MIGLEIRNMYWKHAREQKKHNFLDKGIALAIHDKAYRLVYCI